MRLATAGVVRCAVGATSFTCIAVSFSDAVPVAGLVPLFGIDVWEHAYYLQYKNVRPDYVNAIYKVANWQDVAGRLAAAQK